MKRLNFWKLKEANRLGKIIFSMCLGIPGKVIEIKGQKARLKLPDHEHWVGIGALGQKVKVGDYLLSYQDMAINKVTAQQAEETLKLLNG